MWRIHFLAFWFFARIHAHVGERDVAVAMAVVRFPLTNPGFLGAERDILGFDTALWAWFFGRKTRI